MKNPVTPLLVGAGALLIVPYLMAASAGVDRGASVPLAQSPAGTITVTARGQHVAPATQLVLNTQFGAFAETGGEAAEAFEQSMARTLAGLAEVALEGVEIVTKRATVTYGSEDTGASAEEMAGVFFMGDGPSANEPQGLNFLQNLQLRIPMAADAAAQRVQAAEAIDSAVDLGLRMESDSSSSLAMLGYISPMAVSSASAKPPTLAGELSDAGTKSAREAAQADAMGAARSQAEHLATLAGLKLGRVLSILQTNVASEWAGFGEGVETTCVLEVTFELP